MRPEEKMLPELTAAHLTEALRRFRLLTEEQKAYYLRHMAEVLASSPEWVLESKMLFQTIQKMKPSEQTQGLMLVCFAIGLEVGRVMDAEALASRVSGDEF